MKRIILLLAAALSLELATAHISQVKATKPSQLTPKSGDVAATGTEWTMLVYVQANNNLSGFAMKNFSDMATIGSTSSLNTLVQWYQPNHEGIWRYRVERGRMVLDECVQVESDGTTTKDLVDAMRWAAGKYAANKYALILWNHGIGILDPVWGKMQPWQIHQPRIAFSQEVINDNPRIQINGLTTGIVHDTQHTCHRYADNDHSTTSTSSLLDYVVTSTRGILFNEHSRTYMDNQSLTSALQSIKNNVLGGKKLSLLGMDACLMAMAEVGYLASDYAEVLVASQEVELAQGWNYQALVALLATKDQDPTSIARGIVSTYESTYKEKIPFYTQSAINLEGMVPLRTCLDAMITYYNICRSIDRNTMQEALRKARTSCLQFSSASYVDLHTFLTDFHRITGSLQNSSLAQTPALQNLRTTLIASAQLIEQYVIASTAGKGLARARGLSIYFPQGRIDESYPKTSFAKDGQWYDFIKEAHSA